MFAPLLLLSAALAAPPGYNVTKTGANGCELSLGPAEKDGVVPMRAECYWPEISIDKFRAALDRWGDHDLYWGAVVDSDVKRTDGSRTLVYQKHRSSGIADREVLLWMQKTTVEGYDRYSWTTAAEPLTLQDGNVLCARSEGYWQAKEDPRGGIQVVHTLSYNPGGSVPGFLVRWFQTSGLEANVTDLRAWLSTH